jgi:hypothetical protein
VTSWWLELSCEISAYSRARGPEFWTPTVAFLAVATVPKTREVAHVGDIFLGFENCNSSRNVTPRDSFC